MCSQGHMDRSEGEGETNKIFLKLDGLLGKNVPLSFICKMYKHKAVIFPHSSVSVSVSAYIHGPVVW